MLLIIWYSKPFNEPILNYTNIMTELGLGIIFGLFAALKFDISDFSKKRIDLAIIILVNTIVGVNILGSLAICIKTIRMKIKNRRMAKVDNVPEECKEIQIQIEHLEESKSELRENIMYLKNKMHSGPVYSADNSFNPRYGSPGSLNENQHFFGLKPGNNSSVNSFRVD